jgi:hypothetical protein
MASVDFQVRNGIIANTSVVVGNSSVNTVITPTSITFGGTGTSLTVNTITSTTLNVTGVTTHTGNTTFSNNVLFTAGANVYANGFLGTAGQSLLSNGSSVYWAFSGINVASQYTFSNTITFTGVVSSQANTLNQTLTDGATISWDVSAGQIATVTLAGNRTIAAPTNLKVTTYLLHVIQDATGSRTLTWNSVFKWPAGAAPPLTTTANARDIFSFISDGTNLYGSFLPNVK